MTKGIRVKLENLADSVLWGFVDAGDIVVNGERAEKIIEATGQIVRTLTGIKIKNHERREEDAISENIYLIERENGKPNLRIWAGVNYRRGTEEYEANKGLLEAA